MTSEGINLNFSNTFSSTQSIINWAFLLLSSKDDKGGNLEDTYLLYTLANEYMTIFRTSGFLSEARSPLNKIIIIINIIIIIIIIITYQLA